VPGITGEKDACSLFGPDMGIAEKGVKDENNPGTVTLKYQVPLKDPLLVSVTV
jgi:hypothetical protein